jgi:hypothetical protein
MHAVSDSAASSNENSLYVLGPRMAAHYTRGSAGEHMALRADDVSLLCAWTNAQSHTPVRCALFCLETPPAPLERRFRPQKGPRFYGLEQLQRVRSGDSESCAAYDPAGLPSARLYPGCIHARTPERLLITLLRCTSESHPTALRAALGLYFDASMATVPSTDVSGTRALAIFGDSITTQLDGRPDRGRALSR